MTRRRLTILACLTTLIAAAIWLWTPRASDSPINKTNFDKIHKGMTQAEVTKLLGGPPRDDAGGKVLCAEEANDECALFYADYAKALRRWELLFTGGQSVDEWLSADSVILVGFVEGRVADKGFVAIRRKHETFAANLFKRFGF